MFIVTDAFCQSLDDDDDDDYYYYYYYLYLQLVQRSKITNKNQLPS